jgi:DNA gyrase subunit A
MEGALEALTGRIEDRQLEHEMRSSYLDYAMSVIVGRALPDVRDGLKPVHRRVLYAMHDLGLQPNRPFRKSAFIVGEVMGKYHPHGDQAIYDTLVRMAQEFSLRYPLVDGKGNFGSIDDDPAAAMRYTEARLDRLATEMLRDIEAETVDFGPNYDEKAQEPLVLPARFPNLLVNGSSGIAVGMATNIPPHNLTEIAAAVNAFIDNPEIDLAGLMEHVKGPDFPGGGLIMRGEGIRDAYASGRGSIKVRAKAHIEPIKGGKEAIIVSELPFMVKKGGDGGLIQKIADLVREKKITGISDLRDESDRSGMRLVIEVKRGEVGKAVLNQLYKRTAMQTSFGVNTVALVDGVPRTLGLRELIHHYVVHQREVVTRRTQHELRQAEARAHILEGLLVALDNLDEVIALIRGSEDPETARTGLIERFKLSDEQAQAILDMRLQRLTALESDKVRTEHGELIERIASLRAILGDESRIDGLIKDELGEVATRYGDERRSEITFAEGDLDIEDMIADQQMVISITHSGYVKRLPLATYRQQRRGGIGVMGMDMKEGDYIEHLHICSTHDWMLFFTNLGKVYRLKVYELPEGARTSKGKALVNVLPLRDGERVMAVKPTRDFSEGKYLVFATAKGLVKKTEFGAYNTPIRADGIIAIKIRPGDELVQARLTSGEDDVLLVSKSGHASRFSEKAVRPMGRDTSGVKGMNVAGKIGREPNRVLAMDVARDDAELFVVTENGYGKRTAIAEYPVKGRGTKGVLTVKLTPKKGGLAGALMVREHQDLLFISENGMVQRTPAGGISQMGRATQGVRVMNLREDDRVSAVALVVESGGAVESDGTSENGAEAAASPEGEPEEAEADGKPQARRPPAGGSGRKRSG